MPLLHLLSGAKMQRKHRALIKVKIGTRMDVCSNVSVCVQKCLNSWCVCCRCWICSGCRKQNRMNVSIVHLSLAKLSWNYFCTCVFFCSTL